MAWLPIRYRDFNDLPRAILLEWHGQWYYFDCAFSEELDEYPDDYFVYPVKPSEAARLMDARAAWPSPRTDGRIAIAVVPVASVVFDRTLRTAVESSVMSRIEP
jgi:hypothetical protein